MSAAIRTAVFGSTSPVPPPEAVSNGHRRAGLLACAMMAAGMVAGGSLWLVKRPPAAPPGAVTVVIGNGQFTLPSQLLRPGSRPGRADRIDLALSWPGFGPVETGTATAGAAHARLGDTVLVTVQPADGPAPDSRLSSLYARFLEATVRPGPAGLMIRPFRPDSPYEGEEVLFSPPDGRAFTARCESRAKAGDLLQPVCIADLRTGPWDVQVRFEPRLAEGWERFGAVLLPMIAGMAAPHSP